MKNTSLISNKLLTIAEPECNCEIPATQYKNLH